MPMEQLPINNNGGQGYGFILYQKGLDTIPREITIHNISDRAQVHDFQRMEPTGTLYHILKLREFPDPGLCYTRA